MAILWPLCLPAADLLRPNRSTGTTQSAATAETTPATVTPAATGAIVSNRDRLARTTQSLTAIRQMQQAARDLAKSQTQGLKPTLPVVPRNSFGIANGLVVAAGVPKDLVNPTPTEKPSLWTGAALPTVATQTTNGTETSNVTIKQQQQQAVLNWDSFNIGRDTTLTFDQSLGGTNVGQWIAFNFVRDVTGRPSQILGSIRTVGLPDAGGNARVGGQVYVLNANGIIFGGSSQVNAHALVASSLPINAGQISRGLLVQPAKNVQFQFSALPTSSFDPSVVTDITPVQTPFALDGSGKAGITYGNVEVQAGAVLTAPTNADHVGGKIALIAPNVSNAGTINTDDGRTILAAGLQVGLAPHRSSDPTLRGLDVFVGAIQAPLAEESPEPAAPTDGVVTNTGLIESNRASIYLTGRQIAQSGAIVSTTSVAYNGRVDLVAGYNAVANSAFDPSVTESSSTGAFQPFFYRSHEGDVPTGAPVANSGAITFGAGSLIRVLPEAGSTERVTGDLNLPTQINVQGASIELRGNAAIIAPGASTPVLLPAYGADGLPFAAGVNLRAGTWFDRASGTGAQFDFIHSAENQRIYLAAGAEVDASGLTSDEIIALGGKLPSVADNVISVELRGSELADSPLQRDGPLRGQTVSVDLRRHGAWDPSLNNGQGGYTWVGTPLGDTSGWVGLATHTVGQLSIDGGSVALSAGGAVVVESKARIDVSAGSIDYQGGNVQTTKLESDGHIYDISAATPDRKYTGILSSTVTRTDDKWGVTTTTVNPLARSTYEQGYRQGGNGGALTISGPILALDGDLVGETAAGPQQRGTAPTYVAGSGLVKTPLVLDWLVNLNSLPAPSRMSITVGRQELVPELGTYVTRSPTPADVYFSDKPQNYQPGTATTPTFFDDNFAAARNYEIDLRPDWFGAGKFGGLVLNNAGDDASPIPETDSPTITHGPTMGNLTLPEGVDVDFGSGGFFVGQAANIILEKDSTLRATGGTIDLGAFGVSTSVASIVSRRIANNQPAQFPDYDPSRGNLVVGTGARIDTAGAVVTASLGETLAPESIAGGTVKLQGNNLDLQTSSVVNVSGGTIVSTTGKLTYGAGGAMTLSGGRTYLAGSAPTALPVGGAVRLDTTLQGYAGVGQTGGALSITAPAITVAVPKTTTTPSVNTSETGMLELTPGFFDLGGFSSFSLTGLGLAVDETGAYAPSATPAHAVLIDKGVTIAPKVLNWEYLSGGGTYLADSRLQAPVRLALNAPGQLTGLDLKALDNATAITVAEGARLVAQDGTNAAGSIRIEAGAGGTVDVAGALVARGGQVSLTAAGRSDIANTTPNLHLASTAAIDTSGTTRWAADPLGNRRRDAGVDPLVKSAVTSGGTVTLSGNLVVESGASVSVAGTSDTLQLLPGENTAGATQSPTLSSVVADSNGGTINLISTGLLLVAPTALHGQAGGTTAQAGTLSMTANAPVIPNPAPEQVATSADPGLRLFATTPSFTYQGFDQEVIATATGQSFIGDFEKLTGQALFGADAFTAGRFGALSLRSDNAIMATESVTLTAPRQIEVTGRGVIALQDKAVLMLQAPYVSVGQKFLVPGAAANPLDTTASTGTGSLVVKASSLIDVGNLAVRGAKNVSLDATNNGTTTGSIRGDGTLLVDGDLTLRAGQIYPPTATTFNVVASGTIEVKSSGLSTPVALPLSAGGELNLYAHTIKQGGVLRAPLGTIHLGATVDADGVTTIRDPLTGALVPVTANIALASGSVTSVAAIDPVSGKPLTIPYGVNLDGEVWISPQGTDLTNTGPVATAKSISLTAFQGDEDATGITIGAGSNLNLSGGGDLLAYRFVAGTGGKTDLLSPASNSFVVLPGYADQYAPFAPNNSDSAAQQALRNDPGFVLPAGFTMGDRIHLAGGGGLPAGDYTVLPARYALLPGAYLVTPRSGGATAGAMPNLELPLGSTLMSGYTYNSFDAAGHVQPAYRSYEVSSTQVLAKRAEYETYSGNAFFAATALRNEQVIPRGGLDAGSLTLAVQAAPELPAKLDLRGTIAMTPYLPATGSAGRLGTVDLTTSADIRIGDTQNPKSDELWLNPTQLNGLGSVLIGGTRTRGTEDTAITATTSSITVDAKAVLTNPELILASQDAIVIKDGATITGTASAGFAADSLVVTGNGSLVRVAADANAATTRLNLKDGDNVAVPFTQGELTVGKATFAGASVSLDSAVVSSIATGATVGNAQSTVNLSSGRVALQFDDNAAAPENALVLAGSTLDALGSVAGLSLTSYSSIDFLGDGTLGQNANGQRTLQTLKLNAPTLQGDAITAAGVTLAAKEITLAGAAAGAAPEFDGEPSGVLHVSAQTLRLGSHDLDVRGFAVAELTADQAVSLEGTSKAPGRLTFSGADLTVETPVIVGLAAADQSIIADGVVKVVAAPISSTNATSGLGASLTLTGSSVTVDTAIKLPSGRLDLHATEGDVLVSGLLDVGGATRTFFDAIRSTDGGSISLRADAGDVDVSRSQINVGRLGGDAGAWAGNAGALSVVATQGQFLAKDAKLTASAGTDALGGSFSLDARQIDATAAGISELGVLHGLLKTGGFDRDVALEIREGDVLANADIRAHRYSLTADEGSITLKAAIDASGLAPGSTTIAALDPTGGSIALSASGNVILGGGSSLDVRGYNYDNAGKGGDVLLAAGGYTIDPTTGLGTASETATVTIDPTARLAFDVLHPFTTEDLVRATVPGAINPLADATQLAAARAGLGGFSDGTLHIRQTQAALGDGSHYLGLANQAGTASAIVLEGFQVYDVTASDGGVTTSGAVTQVGSGGFIDTAVANAIKGNGATFAATAAEGILGNAKFHFQLGAEIVNRADPASGSGPLMVTLYNSATAATSSLMTFNLKPGVGAVTSIAIPGGLPFTTVLSLTGGRTYTLTTADGVTSAPITSGAAITSASATNPVIAINFINTVAAASSTTLTFSAAPPPLGSTIVGQAPPVTLVPAADVVVTRTANATSTRAAVGDLTVANTWDLAGMRFGTRAEPGFLTLRSKGDLAFTYGASLTDGFDAARTTDQRFAQMLAPLQSAGTRSWSYQLVAGADYASASPLKVQALDHLGATTGSVLIGRGGIALPTAGTNTISAIVPRYYQTIRTGTGDIDIAAGRDVQLLNPLATVYTAGTATAALAGFDVPTLTLSTADANTASLSYLAQYPTSGGDVRVSAQGDIARYQQTFTATGALATSVATSVKQMPTNWLYRRALVGADGLFSTVTGAPALNGFPEVQSTSWWVDFSNFFDDFGALGGGNLSLRAGRDVANVNAAVPSNARMPGYTLGDAGRKIRLAPDANRLVELGGGDLAVQAGRNVDGGVYYVERGHLGLTAASAITTNSTRYVLAGTAPSAPENIMLLPTTLLLGKGRAEVSAGGDVQLGSVANPFWLPQAAKNRNYNMTFFSTLEETSSVQVTSVGGDVTLRASPAAETFNAASLAAWYGNFMAPNTAANYQPWLGLLRSTSSATTVGDALLGVSSVFPGTLDVTAATGDIDLVGTLALAPARRGNLNLVAGGNVNGLAVNGLNGWSTSAINLSDASPSALPGMVNPIDFPTYQTGLFPTTGALPPMLQAVEDLFAESGSTNLSLARKTTLHAAVNGAPLHLGDTVPALVYAAEGDVSGLTLYSAKSTRVAAGRDVTDIALYIQNVQADDVAIVAAGRDIVAYDANSALRKKAAGNLLVSTGAGTIGVATPNPNSGDIQVSGPGQLEVLAGRDITLGTGAIATPDLPAAGITSVGLARNPLLPQGNGAAITVAAGVGSIYVPTASPGQSLGLASTKLDFPKFIAAILNPSTAGELASRYLPVLGSELGLTTKEPGAIWSAFGYIAGQPLSEKSAAALVAVFNRVLRDAARDRNDLESPNYGKFTNGFAAIAALFPGSPQPTDEDLESTTPVTRPASPWSGRISLPTHLIKTSEGGRITLLAPGGEVTVGRTGDPQKPDQGVLTERGGGISIFAADSVNVGTSRIFTLRGGDEIIWSTWGDIAAGSGSKTVFAAPPTRVLIDPQSGDVQNDLAGLATGSGIGVLATLAGVKPGDVDLIAPVGTVDAGDAGIRSSGNLNLAARVILNAGNIQVAGSTAGTPAPAASLNLAPVSAAASANAAGTTAASEVAKQSQSESQLIELPSLISVEVQGYGGGDDEEDEAQKSRGE